MKQYIKSYFALTPKQYQIIFFLVLPIVNILISLFIEMFFGIFGIIMLFSVFVALEIIGSAWAFDGIFIKEQAKFEYLKFSKDGIHLLKSTMIMEHVRIFLLLIVEWILFLLCKTSALPNKILLHLEMESFVDYEEVMHFPELVIFFFYTVFAGYFFAILGIAICRVFNFRWYAISIVAYLCFLTIFTILAWSWEWNLYLAAGIFSILSIAITVIHLVFIQKRLEEGYYDTTAKNRV